MIALRRIGILGGTFDPVHDGHLAIAREALHAFDLNEVRLMPCQQPVHKNTTGACTADRVRMLELALEGQPQLALETYELTSDDKNYTVTSLRALAQQHPDGMLFWLMGVDAFLGLTSWHDWKNLTQSAQVILVHRPGYQLSLQGELAHWHAQQVQAGRLHYLACANWSVASRDVRQAIAQEGVADLPLPPAVADYIRSHRLYHSPNASFIRF